MLISAGLATIGGALAWVLIRNEVAGRAHPCPVAKLDRRHHCAVDGAPLATEHDAMELPRVTPRLSAGRAWQSSGQRHEDHEQIDWMTPEGENRDPLNDNTLTQRAAPIRELSAPELKALLASGAAIELVDVRTVEERAIAAIDGSRLLDQAYHDALLLRDRDAPIVFQCHHGIRSQHAAEYFRHQGFRNLVQPERRH